MGRTQSDGLDWCPGCRGEGGPEGQASLLLPPLTTGAPGPSQLHSSLSGDLRTFPIGREGGPHRISDPQGGDIAWSSCALSFLAQYEVAGSGPHHVGPQSPDRVLFMVTLSPWLWLCGPQVLSGAQSSRSPNLPEWRSQWGSTHTGPDPNLPPSPGKFKALVQVRHGMHPCN